MRFNAHSFYVKRDDLFDPLLGGNKFRKLYWLWQCDARNYQQIISYGGAQSNAMVALAKLCQLKQWRFDYYVKTLPKHLQLEHSSNLFVARQLGMQLHEVAHDAFAKTVSELNAIQKEGRLVIAQGGANNMAKIGIQALAQEILQQTKMLSRKPWRVVLPSGTGTTAHFLAHYLKAYNIEVYTTAIVGDEAYLKKQVASLEYACALKFFNTRQKWPFAKPKLSYLTTFHELIKQTAIEFDLIYAPRMWQLMQEEKFLDEKIETLYLHTGGVSGNASMLERYKRNT